MTIALIIILGFVTTKLVNHSSFAVLDKNYSYEVKAQVVAVDNGDLTVAGMSAIGTQYLTVEILEGEFAGNDFETTYQLTAAMEFDNQFETGDTIVVGMAVDDYGDVTSVRAIEEYRSGILIVVITIMAVLLVGYAGFVGIKALLSFVLAFAIIWFYTIPALMQGWNPLFIAMTTIALLTAIIMYLIAGFTIKGISAFLGTMVGMGITTGLTVLFGSQLGILGMSAPYAQTVYVSGMFNVNFLDLFYCSIVLGSSGAAMDIAMDVASSMNEIRLKNPELHYRELIDSGLNVGRDVIGTMTTTLLLAYTGSNLTLLMLIVQRSMSLLKTLNMKLFATEIMRTVIGSIGLIIVAPTTAIISGLLYSPEFKAWLAKHFSFKKDNRTLNQNDI